MKDLDGVAAEFSIETQKVQFPRVYKCWGLGNTQTSGTMLLVRVVVDNPRDFWCGVSFSHAVTAYPIWVSN